MFDALYDLIALEAGRGPFGFILANAARASALLLGTALLTLVLHRRSAAGRHLAWTLGMVAVLLLPAAALLPRLAIPVPVPAAFVGQASDEVAGVAAVAPIVGVEAVAPATGAVVADEVAPEPVVRAAPAAVARGVGSGSARPGTADRGTAAVAPMGSPSGVADAVEADRSGLGLPSGGALLIAVWAVGFALVIGGLLVSLARLSWLARRSTPIDSGPVHRMAQRLALRLRLPRLPVLLEGAEGTIPMTWGFRKPVIILPKGVEDWAPWRLEAVLLHELGHVRRRDYAAQLLAQLVCALHWFNPLVWMAAARMRVEREHACDDIVVSSGRDASEYARDLLDLAREFRPAPVGRAVAVCMARPNHLKDRVEAIFDEHRDRRGVTGGRARRIALGALALGAVAATASPVPMAIRGARAQDPAADVRPVATVETGPVSVADAAVVEGSSGAAGALEQQALAGGETTTETLLRVLDTPVAPPSISRLLDDLTGVVPARLPRPGSALGGLAALSPLSSVQDPSRFCGPSDGEGRRSMHMRNDDVTTIELEYGDCETSVRIEGDIQFTEDFTAIRSLSGGSLLRIEVDRGGTSRRLEARPGSGGRPEYTWAVDGRNQPFDANAEAWLAGALLDLFRSTSYKAEERALWILSETGTDGLLQEVGLMRSDHAQATYLTIVIERGDLSSSDVRDVLAMAGRDIESDHSLGQVLLALAEHRSFDATSLGAFLDAARSLESDHTMGQVFEVALARDDLSQGQLETLLETASSSIESDHTMGEILVGMAGRYSLTPALRDPFLRAAATIESDHTRGRVYGVLLEQDGLSAAELGAVLDGASTVTSDHTLGEILRAATRHDLSQPALRDAFLRAASTIESDHTRGEVLREALSLGGLTDADVSEILRSAGEIESDHTLSTLLAESADLAMRSQTNRRAYLAAARSIDSDHSLGQALHALLRPGLDADALVDILEAAREIGSDHTLGELLMEIADGQRIEGRVREAFLQTLDGIESRHTHDRVAAMLVRGG